MGKPPCASCSWDSMVCSLLRWYPLWLPCPAASAPVPGRRGASIGLPDSVAGEAHGVARRPTYPRISRPLPSHQGPAAILRAAVGFPPGRGSAGDGGRGADGVSGRRRERARTRAQTLRRLAAGSPFSLSPPQLAEKGPHQADRLRRLPGRACASPASLDHRGQ